MKVLLDSRGACGSGGLADPEARQKRTAQNWKSEKIIVDCEAPGAFSREVVRARSINRAPPLERV
jgi:hypothetical protein